MSVSITQMRIAPKEIQFKPGKKPQSLKIEWDETFSNPGNNKGLYTMTLSEDADVIFDSVFIPELGETVTISQYEADPASLLHIISFTEKEIIWNEDTEPSNEREMQIEVIITKQQSGWEKAEIMLDVKDNYNPQAPESPSEVDITSVLFKYK